MQSIKNTAISIILLFLSYGVYQVITKPSPSEQNQMMEIDGLEISEATSSAVDNPVTIAANLDLPATTEQLMDHESDAIPQEILDLKMPDASDIELTNQEIRLPSPENTFAHESPASNESTFAVEQVSSQQKLELLENNDVNQRIDFTNSTFDLQSSESTDPAPSTDQHFATDNEIMPSTVLGAVAKRNQESDRGTNEFFTSTPRAAAKPTLNQTWPTILQLVEAEEYVQALRQLSAFNREKNFDSDEEQQLHAWLDTLAAKVIYSTEHHLRSMPYIIQPGDTIGSLARQWQVPAQLIYNININQIPDPSQLTSGVEIKMIQGPFDADVDPDRQILTLYLDDLYAGRFEIEATGFDSAGEFRITDKSAQDKVDRPFWMSLSNGGSIYAVDGQPDGSNDIGLNLREAEELFSILSATSTVRVLR